MTFFQHIWAKKNYRKSAIITAAVLIWLSTGLLPDDNVGAVAHDSVPEKVLSTVKARYISTDSYPMFVKLAGRTEASRDVDLRAELSGKVVALPVDNGQQVTAGDVICELAVEDRQLRLTESGAALDKARMDYDAAQRLKVGGYQSRSAIAATKAKLETARANLKRRELDLANIKIRAPFDGVVDARPVELGDYMDRGDVCATVLDLNPLLITGQVSEAEISRLSSGGQASVKLMTGESATGTIRFIQRKSDPITRTFRIEVIVANPTLALNSGISAQLKIATGEITAHLVSASLLVLDDEGRVGLRTLDDEHRVRFTHVDLIGDHPDGVWVTGLIERPLLITVGQEYVISGEEVVASLENQVVLNAAH